MRILLIDDDPEIRFLAGYVLERARHAVTSAATGAEGIRLAAGTEFDLVLLDHKLGDMTGEAVFDALHGAAPQRPVVFLTGSDDIATVRSLLQAGAADLITKPFDPEALPARVEAVARSSSASRGGGPS